MKKLLDDMDFYFENYESIKKILKYGMEPGDPANMGDAEWLYDNDIISKREYISVALRIYFRLPRPTRGF